MMYVLKKDSERIQREARESFALNPPQPYKDVQPLVIRANKGDEIQVNFYNRLDRRASIHVQGLKYNVLTSDGQRSAIIPTPPQTILSATNGMRKKREFISFPIWAI